MHDTVGQIMSVRLVTSSNGNEVASSVDLHDTVVHILLKNSAFQTLYIKNLGKFLNVLEFGDILPRSISIGSHLLVF